MSTPNLFRGMEKFIQDIKCPKCGGLGSIDDTEPGDMYFGDGTCANCKGTGVIPEVLPC